MMWFFSAGNDCVGGTLKDVEDVVRDLSGSAAIASGFRNQGAIDRDSGL